MHGNPCGHEFAENGRDGRKSACSKPAVSGRRSTGRWIVVAVLLALLVLVGLRRFGPAPVAVLNPSAAPIFGDGPLRERSAAPKPGSEPKLRLSPPDDAKAAPPAEAPPSRAMDRTNIFAALFEPNAEVPLIPEDVVSRWIAAGRTNAADLLAMRQVNGDRKYLLQALTNHSTDPRVLMAALVLKDGPEAARSRLDQLQRSAPNNPLADYLSAQNHLKNGRTAEAFADLAAAGRKTEFDDYSLDASLGAEELYLAAGYSPGEAKTFGTANTLYPHLAPLKDLARRLSELEGLYVAAGDLDSAVRLAAYGVQLGRQLSESGGGKPLIADLTAISILDLTLKPLPQDQRFDFLHGTPAEILAQQRQTRATLTESSNYFSDWLRAPGNPRWWLSSTGGNSMGRPRLCAGCVTGWRVIRRLVRSRL